MGKVSRTFNTGPERLSGRKLLGFEQWWNKVLDSSTLLAHLR
jgi:hypothetical protein